MRLLLLPFQLLPYMLAGGVLMMVTYGLALLLAIALQLAAYWLGPLMLLGVLVWLPYQMIRHKLEKRAQRHRAAAGEHPPARVAPASGAVAGVQTQAQPMTRGELLERIQKDEALDNQLHQHYLRRHLEASYTANTMEPDGEEPQEPAGRG